MIEPTREAETAIAVFLWSAMEVSGNCDNLGSASSMRLVGKKPRAVELGEMFSAVMEVIILREL